LLAFPSLERQGEDVKIGAVIDVMNPELAHDHGLSAGSSR
jgi:hypothetical protein